MKEHTNLYHIFVKDQQKHPMPMECVIRVLSLILKRYEQLYLRIEKSGNCDKIQE